MAVTAAGDATFVFTGPEFRDVGNGERVFRRMFVTKMAYSAAPRGAGQWGHAREAFGRPGRTIVLRSAGERMRS